MFEPIKVEGKIICKRCSKELINVSVLTTESKIFAICNNCHIQFEYIFSISGTSLNVAKCKIRYDEVHGEEEVKKLISDKNDRTNIIAKEKGKAKTGTRK